MINNGEKYMALPATSSAFKPISDRNLSPTNEMILELVESDEFKSISGASKLPANYIIGEPVLTGGIEALYILMQFQSELAGQKYDEIVRRSHVARDLQKYVGDIDAALAQLTKPEDKSGVLNKGLIDYMQKNGILVEGEGGTKTVADYLGNKFVNNQIQGLNQAELKTLRTALDGAANRAWDMSTQAQLIIQKITQAYNVAVNMINSLQGMLHKDNEMIASGMR